MTTNRIDQILTEVRDEVSRRRAAGKFGPGYESGIEDSHNSELGKVPRVTHPGDTVLNARLEELRQRIDAVSSIERDRVRFAPLRFVRELAMSRHQLIRLSTEVRSIGESFDALVTELVASENERAESVQRSAQNLLDVVYERTLVMERLVLVCRELEDRLSELENR